MVKKWTGADKTRRKAYLQLVKARDHFGGKGHNYLYTSNYGLEEIIINNGN